MPKLNPIEPATVQLLPIQNQLGEVTTKSLMSTSLSTALFTEDCNNGIDDDMDGLVDCEDPDCNPGMSSPDYRTIADGPWSSASTWQGGNIPEIDDNEIEDDLISIEHHVTLGQTLILKSSAVLWVTNGSLTLTSGNFRVRSADAFFTNADLILNSGNVKVNHANADFYIIKGALQAHDLDTDQGETYFENVCMTLSGTYESNISDFLFNVCATIEENLFNRSSSVIDIRDSEIKINNGNFENTFLAIVAGNNVKFSIPNGDLLDYGIWLNPITQYCVSGTVNIFPLYLPPTENCTTIQWYFDNCDCDCSPYAEVCGSDTDEDGDGLFDCEDPDCGGTVDLGEDIPSCLGQIDTLIPVWTSPSPPVTFSWSHGLGTDTFAIVSPTITTTYYVTMTSTGGCSIADSVTVTLGVCPEKMW